MLSKTLKVGVFSEDVAYIRALVRYFATIGCEPIFEICTKDEFIKRDGAELWLTDCDELEPQADLFISDKLGNSGVYKYSGGYEIYHELIQACFDKLGIWLKKPSVESSDLVFVISSAGGSGKTEIARGLAEALTRFCGKKVLYLSMEGLAKFEEGVGSVGTVYGLEEYLYFMFSGSTVNINKFLKQDAHGVSEFKLSKSINPLKFMGKEELIEFFEKMREGTDFEYIIVDGGDYGPVEDMLTEMADKICLVETEESLSSSGRTLFEYIKGKRIIGEKGEPDAGKVIRILNKCETERLIYEASNQEVEEDCETEEYIKIYMEEKHKNIPGLDRDFGSGIKILMKKLTTN